MKKAILPSLALALVLSVPAFAQTTIAGMTVPAEEEQLLFEHCNALLDTSTDSEDQGATHTDPANTGEGVDSPAFTTDFSEITASDCRDAGFTEPNSSESE